MKRFFSVFAIISVLLLTAFIAVPASANGPAPPSVLQLIIENAPEEAYGADILVKEESLRNEGLYSELNKDITDAVGLEGTDELSEYNTDGYVSLTCHYNGDIWAGTLEENTYAHWEETYFGAGDAFYWFAEQDSIKIAVYDNHGHILAVSDQFSLKKVSYRYQGAVKYDFANGDIKINDKVVNKEESTERRRVLPSCFGRSSDSDPQVRAMSMDIEPAHSITYTRIMTALIILCCALLTAGIELLLALAFKIRPVWKVPVLTFITNIIMNTAVFFLQLAGINYWLLIAAGEIISIVVEMLIYFRIYRNIHKGRIALFTVVANIASFALTLIILSVL